MINESRSSVRKNKKKVPFFGVAHVKSTFNNTIVNITDTHGNTLFWASGGGSGFRGAKKGTPFAAQSSVEKVGSMAFKQGMRQIKVLLSGPGSGRETITHALKGCGLKIIQVDDITPIAHNGCRPPKVRHV